MQSPDPSDLAPLAPELTGYEVLARRDFMVAIRNRTDLPVEGWTGDYDLIVYENDVRAIMAVGNWNQDGSITGGICWGQGGRIEARDLDGFLNDVARYDSYYH